MIKMKYESIFSMTIMFHIFGHIKGPQRDIFDIYSSYGEIMKSVKMKKMTFDWKNNKRNTKCVKSPM